MCYSGARACAPPAQPRAFRGARVCNILTLIKGKSDIVFYDVTIVLCITLLT